MQKYFINPPDGYQILNNGAMTENEMRNMAIEMSDDKELQREIKKAPVKELVEFFKKNGFDVKIIPNIK